MKKSEIKTDGTTEYAVTPNDYGRQGQRAGDVRLERAVVVGIGPARYGTPGKATVKLLDAGKNYWDGSPNPSQPAGRVEERATRNVVALWSEHVVATKAREEREAAEKAAEKAAKTDLEAKIDRLRAMVDDPDLLPYWVNKDVLWLRDSGTITIDQLIALIESVKQ